MRYLIANFKYLGDYLETSQESSKKNHNNNWFDVSHSSFGRFIKDIHVNGSTKGYIASHQPKNKN